MQALAQTQTPEDLDCCTPLCLDSRSVQLLKLLSTAARKNLIPDENEVQELIDLYIHEAEKTQDLRDIKSYLERSQANMPLDPQSLSKQYSTVDTDLSAWENKRTRKGFINGNLLLIYHNDQYYSTHIKNIEKINMDNPYTWLVTINFLHKATLSPVRPMQHLVDNSEYRGVVPVAHYRVGESFDPIVPETLFDEVIRKTCDNWLEQRMGGFFD